MKPLRQLYPDPNANDTARNTAHVEYVPSHLRLTSLTKSSIIAVHGLNPGSGNDIDHAWDTWRKPSGPQGRLWLRDDLPDSISESRIFLYEYRSIDVYGGNAVAFIEAANELLIAIRAERVGVEDRWLLLLGHGLGRLLIKQAMVNGVYSHQTCDQGPCILCSTTSQRE